MSAASRVPVAIGDELELVVESVGDGPDALARVEGYILFVAGALPGERIRARVTSAGRKHGRADLLAVLAPSADRVEPRCRHFAVCGGCDWQHVAYPTQLAWKTERLRKTLRWALQREDVPVRDMVGPSDPWGQRTKLALHPRPGASPRTAGFFMRRSRDVVTIEECPVHEPAGLRVTLAARDAATKLGFRGWDPVRGHGELRALVTRSSERGDVQTTVVLHDEPGPTVDALAHELLRAGATTVAVNRNQEPFERLLGRRTRVLEGPPRLEERIGDVRYLASPGAFFQTSAFGAAFLVDAVRRLVDPPREAVILDLYCGGGLLGLALADRVARVIGVEENGAAVDDARASAKANRFRNCTFEAGPAERLAQAFVRQRLAPFAVLLDPPRAGCDPRVLEAIVQLAPRCVFYVSCDPAAFGRDLALLTQRGFRLDVVEPLDMFPHTHHIEAVGRLVSDSNPPDSGGLESP